MKIHGMALIRNEASKNRWLKEFLDQYIEICDGITILNDNSTDNTHDIINNYLNNKDYEDYAILTNEKCEWETNELKARRKLFNITLSNCNIGDWIMCLDADELLIKEHIPYLKWLIKMYSKYDVDSIGFKLYDMWSNTHYREDKWWTGHFRYWPMIIRHTKVNYEWQNKKLHCGRFPINGATKMIATHIPIKHMGWSTEVFRNQKYERYMRIDGNKQDGLIEQYKSILDEKPNLLEFEGI